MNMKYFTFLRAGLGKITPLHCKLLINSNSLKTSKPFDKSVKNLQNIV